MKSGHLSVAAIDVYKNEPYNDPLKKIKRYLMTSHMGSMTTDCRTKMEIESTEEFIRSLTGELLKRNVPKQEYDVQRETL
jgi:D-3-phosphoglycerate dehydrogenase